MSDDLPTEAVEAADAIRAAVLAVNTHGRLPLPNEHADAAIVAALPYLPQHVSPSVEDIARTLDEHDGADTIWTDKQRCACGTRPDRTAPGYVGFRAWLNNHRAESIHAALSSQPTVAQVRREALDEVRRLVDPIIEHSDGLTRSDLLMALDSISVSIDSLADRARAAEAGAS